MNTQSTHEIWKSAHAQFETYAAMAAPDLPDDPMSSLQVRLHRWQVANFGWQPAWMMVLGIVEETMDELYLADSEDEVIDAVGDTMIFATQLCTDLRLDFGVLVRASRDVAVRVLPMDQIAPSVGRIAHFILKSAQGIRGFDDEGIVRAHVSELIACLIAGLRGYPGLEVELEDAYRLTAEHVMTRNWKADRMTGSAA